MFIFLVIACFFETRSIYLPQVDLEFDIFLPQLPYYWDQRHKLPCLGIF